MTTTDQLALLRSIVEHPHDDTPRLIYADAREESGDADRAEFIRVGIELANLSPPHKVLSGRTYLTRRGPRCWTFACEDHETEHGLTTGDRVDVNLNVPSKKPRYGLRYAETGEGVLYEDAESRPWAGEELLRRERKLMSDKSCIKWFDTPSLAVIWTKSDGICGWYTGETTIRTKPGRGFIGTLRCDWTTFLKHHQSLLWHAGSDDECSNPKCIDGEIQSGHPMSWPDCQRCKGTGRIPRPFPATAQPITDVWFSAFEVVGGEYDESEDGNTIIVATDDGVHTFTRVKCPACDGAGVPDSPPSPLGDDPWCSKCRDVPPNDWHCDTWPGVIFHMPTEER